MDRKVSSVAIIGAGPCGLSQLRAFAQAEAAGVHIPEIVCYEKQSDWGGLWNFSWETGTDKFGEAVHNGMYKNLWMNGPKECYEYADYTFDKHFAKPVPSYLTREDFRDYILGRAKESNLKRFIVFNNAVRLVEFDQEKDQFKVCVEDLTSGKHHIHLFDYVIVATGHFSTPHVPDFEGIERFPGRVLHSHDFRDAEQFVGLNLLVIGGSYSAEDIALQCYKFGAKSITVSYRTKPMGFRWPKGIEEVPLLTHIEDNIVHFKDGSRKKVDIIVFCTGYRHHFPFITDQLRLITSRSQLHPSQLYKGILFQDQPRLIYLGMNNVYFSTTLFDAQAWYARDVILKRIRIPELEERTIDIGKWQARESLLAGPLEDIDLQASYMEELMDSTDCTPFKLKAVVTLLKEWEHDKEEDILGYRNQVFTSPITGTKSIAPSVLWINAKHEEI